MTFELRSAPQAPADLDVDTLVLPLFEDEPVAQQPWADLDTRLDGLLGRVLEWGETRGKAFDLHFAHTSGRLAARRVALLGLGKRAEFDSEPGRRAAGALVRKLRNGGTRSAGLVLPGKLAARQAAQCVAEGALLGLFDADQYRGTREETRFERVLVACTPEQQAEVEAGLAQGCVLGEAANFARLLVNEPGNILTPRQLADRARALATDDLLTVEVLGPQELAALGMGALLSVARGSEEPAQLIVLRYHGAESGPYLGFVGKGITFDTGGISIKPAERMHLMKDDMSGAAAVLGACKALSKLRPAYRVLSVIPACENMPSGRAARPGDVVRAMSGKTIEIINTDAEGRLVLADALTYAQRLGAAHLVDLATLTGGVVVTLGNEASAVLGRPQSWVERVKQAAEEAGERLWQLPLWREYRELIKSDIADIKNSGGRPAQTITGAMFLADFVEEKTAWAHLDIAAMAWDEKSRPYRAAGPTGVGVHTLVALAQRWAEEPPTAAG
ncbi:MAG: leucyl aminopeptidase [Chloroflexi bacterium]|nr:leucyl aminopeptidase [Chloroflexota bacterium]